MLAQTAMWGTGAGAGGGEAGQGYARVRTCDCRVHVHGMPGWPVWPQFPHVRRHSLASCLVSCSALQEQKGELRKRLSYTTHKLEKLETEFDSTRHFLEIELRRAQEELDKVTEKLRK